MKTTKSPYTRLLRAPRAYRNLRRVQQILLVFFKYGFSDVLERIKVGYVFKLRRKIRPHHTAGQVEKMHPAA